MTTQQLPQAAIELLRGKNFGNLATLMPDGSPQVTPVWVDTDGTYVLVNTSQGRQKARNLERNARVAIDVLSQENPYKYLQVRGHVADMTSEGAEEQIHAMAKKYQDADRYPLQPGEQRILIKIAPDKVQVSG